MTSMTRRLFGALVIGAMALTAAPAFAQTGTPHLILTVKGGDVDIELLPSVAPKHVERVVALTEAGAYDNVIFHRVIDGFMAQTGDVKFGKSDGPDFDQKFAGTGGSDQPDVVAEFNNTPFERGVLGAARSSNPNSFNSQFFITFEAASHLNNQYTAFGKVVSGMEYIDQLEKGPAQQNGAVANPDKIIKARIEYK
jgi:cyclophilin family peptidyl-prolyl cis-trans isomerase